MEDLKKDLLDGIGAIVDQVMLDPTYHCIYCKVALEFRIDQFTRQEPDAWIPTVIILRDEGWAKVLRSDDAVLGRVCPSCIEKNKPKS
jgi:hypothetical protein